MILQHRSMARRHGSMALRLAGRPQVISGEKSGRRLIGATIPGEKGSLTLRARKRGAKSAPMKIGINDKVTQKRRRETTQLIAATLNVGSAPLGPLYPAKITGQKNLRATQSNKRRLNVGQGRWQKVADHGARLPRMIIRLCSRKNDPRQTNDVNARTLSD
jgi:hypothetical protein